MTYTYRISRGAAAYYGGFGLVWFGLIVGFGIVGIIDDVPGDQAATRAGAAVVTLLIASAPMLVLTRVPYEVTLRDHEECEFRALLRQRWVRVQQIRSIRSDEHDIYIRYDGGKVHMLMGSDDFEDFFIRLVELNPAIEVKGWLRRSLDEAASTSRVTENG